MFLRKITFEEHVLEMKQKKPYPGKLIKLMSQYIRVLSLYEQIYENIHITKQYERMSEYIRIKNGMNIQMI